MTSQWKSGKCLGGPYAGQKYVHERSEFKVFMCDGNLDGALVQREGVYEFHNGVWIWDGPSVKAADYIGSRLDSG